MRASAYDNSAAAHRVYKSVQSYYDKQLQRTSDLQSYVCCSSTTSLHPVIAQIMKKIPSQVKDKYYSCGTPVPLGIEGLSVVDLDSSSRRDAYIISALVGSTGLSTGIGMTLELINIAESHVDEYTETLGYLHSNLRFVEGHMEDLEKAGIADQSIDVVISNCVLNLSPQKQRVLSQVHRVLRDGGEFFFSDVYAMRRLPESVRKDPILHGECLGGALYVENFKRLCRKVGFGEPRELSATPVVIGNPAFEEKVGLTEFSSITFQCFKLQASGEFVEDAGPCEEDYGHTATYLGTIPGHSHAYALDTNHHQFETHRPKRIGGTTAAILQHSWLSKYFRVTGDRTIHFGVFKDNLA